MRKVLVVAFVILALTIPAYADSGPEGAAVYKAKCAMCHGPDGKKENKAMGTKPLTSPEVQKMSDKELYDITANGKNKMPAYKAKLTDAEIKALVVTIRDLAKK